MGPKALAALVGFVVASGVFAADALADTITVADNSTVAQWGVDNTATYGQTVTVPGSGGTVLESFTFSLGTPYSGAGDIDYQAYVYAWDSVNSRATGSALYQSGVATLTPGSMTDVTFSPGVNLVAGNQYVLFFSTSGLQAGEPLSTVKWESNSTDAYSGGTFVYQNNGNNAALWTSSPWSIGFGGAADLAFTAVFSPVPEPTTLALFGLGAAGMAWRRRRAARAARS